MEGKTQEATETVEQLPPGWYPDPQQPDLKSYWDGEKWGEEPRPERRERDRPTGKANRLAVTALICAVLVPVLFVTGILAIVFGEVALDEIEESQGAERGAGMAKWAIGLGVLNVAVSCAVIALIIASVVAA